ncbi:general substrate transporter [Xylogone sp. PMI_703]|nr:general substrate transporter [Xylogone sp. PMI_703]
MILTCMFVMSGALVFGIDVGEIGGFMAMTPFLKDYGYLDEKTQTYNIRASSQEAINLLVLVGAILSSMSAGWIGSRFGRRVGLFLGGFTALIGSIMQCASTAVAAVYVGRIFLGGGVGYASNFVPVYNAEVSPVQLRGMMVGFYQTGINIGQLVGACIDQRTHAMTTRWAYRIPLLTQMFFPLVIGIGVWLLPETPRWLLTVDKPEKAAESIRRLRGRAYPEQRVQEEIEEIASHVALEREMERSTSYQDILRGTNRRRTHIACGVALWQVLSGPSFINVYGTYFFTVSGVKDAFTANITLQATQLAGILLMFPSLRWLGRRIILIWGGAAQTVCMFMILTSSSKSLVAFCCLYGFFFTWSWGSVGWIVISEIASTALRSRTQSLATSVGWLGTMLINIILPYLINTDEANLGVKVRLL